MPETIVIGLDGANWDLLEPWIESGDLSHIAELRNQGVSADMQSELPPVTCPNWRCYSTGKNPGKLGVYWWEKINTETQTLSKPNSRSFKSANYWDYLGEFGLSAGIVNLPMTYPPFELDGFMIAGGPGSEQKGYTTPESLGKELEKKGYQLHPDNPVNSSSDTEAAEELIDLIDQRLVTFHDLIEKQPVDVAHCTIFYINTLHHYFWRDEPTLRAWKIIDEHIGKIRETYPEATLLLMSDHGCTEIDTMFYANAWLEREGFLETKPDAASFFQRLGINERRLGSITQRLGIRHIASQLAPKFIRDIIPQDEEGVKRERKLDLIDWGRSRALASGQGLIYLLDGEEKTREDIVDKLSQLKSEISEAEIARNVFRREEAYNGPYIEEAPNIVFDQTPGIHTSGAIGDNPIFEAVSHWKAENVRTGLFLADGPDVSRDIDREIKITDVAPTVLHSVGCPVPDDIDGKPIRIFDYEQPTTTEPLVPEFVEGQSSDKIENRLEDLGYLQ